MRISESGNSIPPVSSITCSIGIEFSEEGIGLS